MDVLKKVTHTDANDDLWDIMKLDGRFGVVWCSVRKGDNWDMPFFATKKAAIQNVNDSV